MRNNAERISEKLKIQQIEAVIVVKKTAEKQVFLLHTGSFNTRETALKYGEKHLKPLGVSYYPIQKN